MAIASGSVSGIHEENMVQFLFCKCLTKLFDFTTYFRYGHSFGLVPDGMLLDGPSRPYLKPAPETRLACTPRGLG
jgi:uncharacterized protein YigE (DUF2233 family)